jgi:hypothetical protein
VPSYFEASIALLAVSFLLVVAIPTPRMHPSRAGSFCLGLMLACLLTFAVSASLIVLAMLGELPGPVVVPPAVAVLGVSVTFSATMFWMSSAEAPERAADADESDGDDSGGGGGLRPEDEPPRDPGPSDGIAWDAFDRERQAWEAARTERDRVLVDV